MAATVSLPWIEKARAQIQNLQEWKDFTAKLNDAVQQQMTESNINTFTDLSESEKVFVLEKASRALHAGQVYSDVSAHISSCLEENIYNDVAHELQDSDISKSHSDLVARYIQDGVISILEKRPGLKVKLHALFNQPLPVALRAITWRLHLSNTKARMEYLTQESMNKARSVLDGEILLQCQALLSQEQTCQRLKDIKYSDKIMRNVLSYYHKHKHIKGRLLVTNYLLLVPLIQAVMETMSPDTSLVSISALLVEQYITFMDSRPSIMQDSSADTRIFMETAQLLKKLDSDLAQTIQSIYTSQANKLPQEALLLGTHRILQPILQVLFVGYLNMNTLMYVWDQYIIGLDEPVYNCLPAFSLAFLMLLREHLSACTSHQELEIMFKTQGPTLSVQEFQTIINMQFYSDLYGLLNKGESSQYPVHDPTQAFSQWSHFSKATILSRTRPQDRRRAREEREMIKKQTAERQQKEEEMRQLREDDQKRRQEDELHLLLEDTKRRFEEQKAHLENQLKQKQQENYNIRKEANEQISELEGEIRRLKQQRRVSSDGFAVESLSAPPPSVNSQNSNPRKSPNPPTTPKQAAEPDNTATVKEAKGKTSNTAALHLLNAIMMSADLIINGQSTEERDTLNEMTKKHLKNYKEDIKNAEIEVFGHELELNELGNVKEPERTALAKRLALATERGVEARYTATLKPREKQLMDTVTYTNAI
ncbi:uncharacterized protein LOC128474620 [Spea bombifrons]|uniref:uncharacterized protein LOC128474620 n=1 Tax=Spea bombifrons TaxID=233779 RepID=UPI00234A741A|nr:uncharacterized protein LOC128474620 [Spea bombifrons]